VTLIYLLAYTIYDKNMSANQTLTGTNIGGTTKSVSQLSPVFSYPTESGRIYVYVVKAGFFTSAIITLDVVREDAYAVKTLVDPSEDVFTLVKLAEKQYKHPLMPNPFTRLFNDSKAMSKLIEVLKRY